jgi:hypothetical protein
MSQRNLLKGLIISASVGVLLVGFQNCSNKISQQDVSAEALKQAANDTGSNDSSSTEEPALDSDQLPDNSSTIVDQPAIVPPGSQPPVDTTPVINPPVANQPPQEIPPVKQPPTELPPVPVENPISQEDKDCINWALDDEPEVATSSLKSKSSNSKHDKDEDKENEDTNEYKNIEYARTPSEKCYVKSDEDKDDIDYENICRLNKKQIKFLNVVSNILKLLKLRGMTVLTPESVGSSSLATLEDARGTTILCGLKVDKVNNTRGKLVALDSTIKSFSNHRGKAVFINSTAENCKDIKGKFVLLGATSACKSIEGSKGLVQIDRGAK